MRSLDTPRLLIRNWRESDRAAFHFLNSDDEVMRFFPFRRTRAQSDDLLDRIRLDNEARGYGFAALELRATGECIGFAGLQPQDIVAARPAGTVEIGWRLAPAHWGRGYASEAAEALLEFGFETLGLEEIVSFAVWNNERSIAVMRRIGMVAEPSGDFDHPRVPDTHRQLRRHVLYVLAHELWRRRRDAGQQAPLSPSGS